MSGSEQADATHDRDLLEERRAVWYPVEFRGSAREYFPIWIVNVVLCILIFSSTHLGRRFALNVIFMAIPILITTTLIILPALSRYLKGELLP